MLIEAFSQTILRWLRIPPGVSLRKASGPSTTSTLGSVEDNEYIQAILDITVDDICIGDEPLSINFEANTPEDVQLKLKDVCKEFNEIVKWVARDLCVHGYSIYDVSVEKNTNKLIVIPYIDEVQFYLTKDKKVVLFDPTSTSKKSLKDKLVFINYSKKNLSKIETKGLPSDLVFVITPEPMQLKSPDRTISGLESAENSIAKYRSQLGRIARWANVDIGASQGDQQKDVVDSIASAINANSSSLANGTAFTDFDDNIPVLPNRRGIGKVEIVSDIPDANLKDLADLDYWLGKLNLLMRFPATYMDFSKTLNETAVSMVRGDLRYAKLCNSVRSKIESTLNYYIQSSKFNKYNPVFSLTQLPSSEDDDVMDALSQYTDLVKEVEEFINDPDITKDLKLHRLKLIQDLLATSTKSPALQKWFEDFRVYIEESKGTEEEQEVQELDSEYDISSESDQGGDIEEVGLDIGDLDSEVEYEEPIEESAQESGEFVEPATEV